MLERAGRDLLPIPGVTSKRYNGSACEAADMFRRGKPQEEVPMPWVFPRRARRAGTRCRREGGRKALAGTGRAGRLPRLSDEQLAHVVEALKAGPRANGFSTDLWTLKRVAEVIESAAGVRYGTSLTWEVLRWLLGWSRQWPPGAPSSATTRPKQTGPPSTGHA